MLALAAAGIWLYSKRGTVDHFARMSEEIQASMRASAMAPGGEELRAFGCNRADIMNMRGVYDAVGIVDAGPAGELHVICNIRIGMDEPLCNQVAVAYVDAVGQAAQPFTAAVRREETNQYLCREMYTRDGTRL